MVKESSIADVVAVDMNDILHSEELRSLYAKPNVKTAAKKKNDEEDEADSKGKKKTKKDKEDPKAKGKGSKDKDSKDKDSKDKGKKSKKSKAEQVDIAIRGLAKISEILDEVGYVKSSVAAIGALESIVVESSKKKDDDEDDDEDDKKKDKKDDKKGDKEDDKDDDKEDKDEDSNDDRTNLGLMPIDERSSALNRKMPEHGSRGPFRTTQKYEKPAPESTPKAPEKSQGDETYEIEENMADDANEDRENLGLMPIEDRGKALNRKMPEHGSRGPFRTVEKFTDPPEESTPKAPEKSQGGETYVIEENMVNDCGDMGDMGNAHEDEMDELEGAEELRELLDALGLDVDIEDE